MNGLFTSSLYQVKNGPWLFIRGGLGVGGILLMGDGEHVDLYSLVSREEISAFKRSLVESGGLREATKILQRPETKLRASAYPTTSRLFRVWSFLGFSHILFLLIIPVILFFLTRWYLALASVLFDITIMHWVHNAVNIELFARLYFTDKWMEEMDARRQSVELDQRNK